MGLIIHVVVFLFVLIVVLLAVSFFVVDMFRKVEYFKIKVPWLDRIIERRSAIGALLLVAIFLLVGDGYQLILKEIPDVPPAPTVVIKAPAAPTIQVVSHQRSVPPALDKSGPLDRFLNSEQKEHLFQQLKIVSSDPRQKEPLTVTIAAAYPHDRESSRLAMQLVQVFQDAGWRVVGQQAPNFEQQTQGQIPIGIWVRAANNMGLWVELTLINAGLGAEFRPQDSLPADFKGVLILVGYKSGPF